MKQNQDPGIDQRLQIVIDLGCDAEPHMVERRPVNGTGVVLASILGLALGVPLAVHFLVKALS